MEFMKHHRVFTAGISDESIRNDWNDVFGTLLSISKR
jgi:hypothetical protein